MQVDPWVVEVGGGLVVLYVVYRIFVDRIGKGLKAVVSLAEALIDHQNSMSALAREIALWRSDMPALSKEQAKYVSALAEKIEEFTSAQKQLVDSQVKGYNRMAEVNTQLASSFVELNRNMFGGQDSRAYQEFAEKERGLEFDIRKYMEKTGAPYDEAKDAIVARDKQNSIYRRQAGG